MAGALFFILTARACSVPSQFQMCIRDRENAALEITSVEKKAKKTMAPGLYDLTTLQREANLKYGFSAKETLNIMQRLYDCLLYTSDTDYSSSCNGSYASYRSWRCSYERRKCC